MLKLRDIMTRDPVAASPEMTLRECVNLLTSQHVSGLPVVAGRRVVGVVSASDVLSLAAIATPEPVPAGRDDEWPRRDVLDAHTVGEVMTPVPCALPPDADVTAAADFMRREGIHRLLVVDGDRLAGIVSALDVVRAVADRRLTTHTYVFDSEDRFDTRGWE